MPPTRTIILDPDRPSVELLDKAARVLKAGGLVAFATETVYGLGADATDPKAVARIFEAKGRPATNPLIVHAADLEMARACVSAWPDTADRLATAFWPGPLTLVLPRSAIIPDMVTAGQSTVGVRIPEGKVAHGLIVLVGRPLAAPSANRSTGISPTTAAHVLKDLDGKADLILDSGPTRVGIESTVLDLTTDPPRVLRPGEITVEQIAEVLGKPVSIANSQPDFGEVTRSPGQMAIHYAPATPTFRIDRDHMAASPVDGKFGLLVIGEGPSPPGGWPGEPCLRLADPTEAAVALYASLHRLDDLGLDFILIVTPPEEPRWRAIRDRIARASRPWTGPCLK